MHIFFKNNSFVLNKVLGEFVCSLCLLSLLIELRTTWLPWDQAYLPLRAHDEEKELEEARELTEHCLNLKLIVQSHLLHSADGRRRDMGIREIWVLSQLPH